MEFISRKASSKVYDAVIVGSGAAGGMAAYVMANAGMNVLVLEAGPKLDLYKDFKTHAWPYEEKYRGRISPRPNASVPMKFAFLLHITPSHSLACCKWFFQVMGALCGAS